MSVRGREQNSQRKRSCTDLPCCFIFLIFIICFVLLSIFAFIEGDPRQIFHPTDSQGNLCGTGIYSDRRYLYFFDWTECIQPVNPTSLLSIRHEICRTKQVCVSQCPSRSSFYKLKNYPENVICDYDVDPKDNDIDKLIRAGQCPSYVIASKPLFGRCVPNELQSLVNSLVQVTDNDGTNYTIDDIDGNRLNGSAINKGVEYLIELLNVKEIAVFLLEDLAASWKLVLVGLVLSCVLCFVWIVLMRCLVKPIVWLSIFAFLFTLSAAMAFSYYEFVQLRNKNDNQLVNNFKFVADANYYRSLPITWLIIGIILSILLIIVLLIFLVLLKRIRIALAILQEASKAVSFNFFSLFWPFVPFTLQLLFIVYWACLAIFLSTSGKPIYRLTNKENLSNFMNEYYGQICDPMTYFSKNSSYKCVFSQYGYDAQINFDQYVNGTQKHLETFVAFVNEHQWIPQFYSIFMLFWLTSFIIGFGQLVLAGVYSRYYWDREHISFPCSALIQSFVRSLLLHLGTVAFGSLLIAIVKLFRFTLEYVQKKVEKRVGKLSRCLFCCCRCCLFCLENFLKFLNRNAYIVTAINGTGFIRSARRAFQIIISNPLQLLVIDKTCDFFIFLAQLMITLAMGFLSFFVFTKRIAHANDYIPDLHYYFIPIILIIIGTYVITKSFFSVYSMAVDTLFICALEDLEKQKKNKNHQLMMPKGLRKVFRAKNTEK